MSKTRFALDEEAGAIEGYAAIFNDLVPAYREKVAPGAFTKSLAEHKAAGTRPVMLWNHDTDEVIGVWSDFIEDKRGLKVRGKILSETRRGAEARAVALAGGLSGLSIGFRALKDRVENGVRIIEQVELYEVSLTAFPASKQARFSVRSDRAGAAVASLANAAKVAARALSKR